MQETQVHPKPSAFWSGAIARDPRQLVPHTRYARVGKPVFDWLLLLTVLPPALLIGCVIAALNAVQLRSLRRVFFLQPRVGYLGQTFRIIKFRTMRDAPAEVDGNYNSWAAGVDRSRVTPFGRFLRNSHLDELPQILNVLRGEMSFIGPRPEMIEIEAWASTELPHFKRRLALKPGITGWAQITQGYASMDIEAYSAKATADGEYLRTMSLGFDLLVLVRTMVWMVRGKGWAFKPGAQSTQQVLASTRRMAHMGALETLPAILPVQDQASEAAA